MGDLERNYYEWLCHQICTTLECTRKACEYSKLLYFLYSTPFDYTIEMDFYRAQSGINLRYDFGKEKHVSAEDISGYLTDKSCSVLEMIIALCKRIDYILMDSDKGDTTGTWFWTIIGNLMLDKYPDHDFKPDDVIVRNLLNRDYTKDGVGSMFPMPGCRHNLREVDIWYQAMWYVTDSINWSEEEQK